MLLLRGLMTTLIGSNHSQLVAESTTPLASSAMLQVPFVAFVHSLKHVLLRILLLGCVEFLACFDASHAYLLQLAYFTWGRM